MLCWKLGEPRSGVALLAEVVDAVLMVVVHKLAVPLGQAFGGLVTRKLSDSDRFFTWCITPGRGRRKMDIRNYLKPFIMHWKGNGKDWQQHVTADIKCKQTAGYLLPPEL